MSGMLIGGRSLLASMVVIGMGGILRRVGEGGVSLWKHIQSGWSRFSRYVHYTIGSGDSVRFWLDSWSEEGLLRDVFPAIYNIALHKQATMSKYFILA